MKDHETRLRDVEEALQKVLTEHIPHLSEGCAALSNIAATNSQVLIQILKHSANEMTIEQKTALAEKLNEVGSAANQTFNDIKKNQGT